MVTYKQKEGTFKKELISKGTHSAMCTGFFDAGMWETEWKGVKKVSQKVIILFEVDEKYEEGKKAGLNKTIQAWFNFSLGEMSKLRPFLESLRGDVFKESELLDLDCEQFVGMPCLLSIGLTEKGADYILAATPQPKGMKDLVPDALFKGTDEPEYIEKLRMKSSLYGAKQDVADEDEEDSVPF